MKNKQVLIDSLPEGKLVENNYKLVESEMPKASSEEIIVKTISFAITAGTRAGLQGSASYAGAPTAGIVMNCTGIGEIIESIYEKDSYTVGTSEIEKLSPNKFEKHVQKLEKKMLTAAENLDFEKAAMFRDEIRKLKKDQMGMN